MMAFISDIVTDGKAAPIRSTCEVKDNMHQQPSDWVRHVMRMAP